MERINQFEFFDLGQKLQKLHKYEAGEDVEVSDAFFPIVEARSSIRDLLNGQPLELNVSRACAVTLSERLGNIIDEYFREPDGSGGTKWKLPTSGVTIPSWHYSQVRKALEEFETVFREEVREAAVYRVPDRGIFNTSKLVDAADRSFPEDLASMIPQKTKDDWRAAGRCLAFNLLSASGFHVARAVEGMMEVYYQRASGIVPPAKKATLNSWGDYIKALEGARTASPPKTSLVPSEKVITEIQQMKDDYRNPIAHPRIVLSEADARMLFANGESLIIAMAQEVKAAAPAPAAAGSYLTGALAAAAKGNP